MSRLYGLKAFFGMAGLAIGLIACSATPRYPQIGIGCVFGGRTCVSYGDALARARAVYRPACAPRAGLPALGVLVGGVGVRGGIACGFCGFGGGFGGAIGFGGGGF